MTKSQFLAADLERAAGWLRAAAFLAHFEVSYAGTAVAQGPVLQQ